MHSWRFSRVASAILAFNLAVIGWGAFVRATGSGAGCGAHWPLCNGEIIPRAPRIETIIELSHRVSSGLAILLIAGLALWGWRTRAKGDLASRAALVSLLFVATEALIGAALVLLRLVAYDASLQHAASMALHLMNTFLLLASLTLTVHFAAGHAPRRIVSLRRQGALPWVLAVALGATLMVGTSGAIAALGDTLFPSRSLALGVAQDFSATANVLLRLRALHPLLAVIAGVLTVGTAAAVRALRPTERVRNSARLVVMAFVVQLAVGLLNLVLLAPVWMQLVHLLLADAAWIALVLLAAEALGASAHHVEKGARADERRAPVDEERRSGHVTGRGRNEEENGFANLVDGARASERDALL
jgi:heme A synthase